jgi:ribosomal protein S27E
VATEVTFVLDLQCARCEAQTTTFELELPDGIEQPSEPTQVRIGVTARCTGCGQEVIFGHVPAEAIDRG